MLWFTEVIIPCCMMFVLIFICIFGVSWLF